MFFILMVGMPRWSTMLLTKALENTFHKFILFLPYFNIMLEMAPISTFGRILWLGEIAFLDWFPHLYHLSSLHNAVISMFSHQEGSHFRGTFCEKFE